MEKDIKTIKNWVTFFGVLTIITILVGLHTMYQTYKATRLYEEELREELNQTNDKIESFYIDTSSAPIITIDATEAPDASN
jgi:hypothetical protein